MKSEQLNIDRSRFLVLRFIHQWLGRLLLTSAIAQGFIYS
jgi:hypothetical protein